MKSAEIAYSIVIPVFNEEGNIADLHESLADVLKRIGASYEILFVDDGSADRSFEIIRGLAGKDRNVRGLSLSRNFGHQVALTAGLEESRGDAVIMMDGDMQHPPELISDLIRKYQEGYDIVNTVRNTTQGVGLLKRLSSKVFYKVLNYLSDVPIESGSADFRLMNRRTVNAFLRLKEKDRFTRGLVGWMGFRQTKLYYDAAARKAGKSKYTQRRMFHFAVDGLTSFSAKPLRISFYTGLLCSVLGLFYAVYAVVENLRGQTIPGWTSILVSVLIIGGAQLISIGIVGEYLARVFSEAKDRPLYFIKEDTRNY